MNIMSGAANEGVFGNSGFRRGGWNSAPGPGWHRQGSEGRSPDWRGDYFMLWSLSRPLLIAAAIIGFLLWWPVGLALLFVAIWNRRVGRYVFGGQGPGAAGGWARAWPCRQDGPRGGDTARPSGNRAFDEYKAETLRRLEEEQGEFSAFLERLRFAKDKAEFDQFMSERRPRPPVPQSEA